MNFPKITNIKINRKELIIILVLLSIAFLGFLSIRISSQGTRVEIKIAQKLYGTYDLSIDREILVSDEDGHNILICKINDGSIQVIASECPDKICIDEGVIKLSGQTIVCLPNKVVISIIGNEETIDGVLK